MASASSSAPDELNESAEIASVLRWLAAVHPDCACAWHPTERVLRLRFLFNGAVASVACAPPLVYAESSEAATAAVANICEGLSTKGLSTSSVKSWQRCTADLLQAVYLARERDAPGGSDGVCDLAHRVLEDPARRAGCDCLLTLLNAALLSTRRTELFLPPAYGASASKGGAVLDDATVEAARRVVEAMPPLTDALSAEQAWVLLLYNGICMPIVIMLYISGVADPMAEHAHPTGAAHEHRCRRGAGARVRAYWRGAAPALCAAGGEERRGDGVARHGA